VRARFGMIGLITGKMAVGQSRFPKKAVAFTNYASTPESYGFRPGRSQHQALDALYTGLLTRKVNWVLDLDIKAFFGAPG
jgi:retron-type reverse transcriptase